MTAIEAAPRTAAATRRAAATARKTRVAADSRRLVVVSNRVGPIERGKAAQGGLAMALGAALERVGGIWFGFSGEVTESPSDTPNLVTERDITSATLSLTKQDYDEYYVGFSNRVLWPLFHYRPSLVDYSRQQFAGYQRVNEKFARALYPMMQPRDLLWVHDYHLIPFGQVMRRLGWQEPIGFFLHTPFPAAEMLRLLPHHRDLVEGLCSYDLVGFQSRGDLHGFQDYVLRFAGGEDLGGGVLRAFGRRVHAAVFPIGIDVDTVAKQALAAEKSRHQHRLRESIDSRALMIGVDRIDYSKGLPARFEAYSYLLEHHKEARGRIIFMQIAPRSREDVPEFREIHRRLDSMAGRINGSYGEFDWTPVRYLNKGFPHRTLMGFYRAAQIGLVTPFRDGMNLVAKEYLASQDPANPGMLVLSCLAGAADELGEALIINPYDIQGMAEAIRQGLDMPLEERKERWTAMMDTLRRNDISAWRTSFVEALVASEMAGRG